MAVKFLSHGHFSGSNTDLTLDGQLFLPSHTTSPAAPTISFDSNAGGIWYESDVDALHFRASGANRAYISSAGITSLGNVYTAVSGQFRNYGGEWHATTGTTGNGFKFTNTADNVDALTLSATGNAVFTGNVTVSGDQFTLGSGVYETVIFDSSPSSIIGNGTMEVQPTTAPGSGTANFTTYFKDKASGGTTKHHIKVDGDVTANSFIKSGGTSSQFLMADGSVSTGGGSIDGTGTANKLAIWSDQDSLTNDTFLHWDTTNNRLGVNNSGPSYTLDVGGTSRIAGTIHMYGAVRNYSGNFSLQNGVQDADIFFKVNDGGTTTTAMTVKGSSSFIGIGTASPLEKLHVMYADTAGISTVYSKGLIEDTDAQLDLLSTSAGTWGSAINFVESAGSNANTDVWSIARKTTGGSGDSSLNFNFGTNNQHDNTNRISFSSAGDLTAEGSISMNQSNTQVTMSGNTSGNFTLDNNTGSIAFQANGSTVNSMTITSSAITLNENTTATGTFDPQGNILGAVIDDGNSANPLQVRRSAATTMQVGINFTVSPSSGSGFSRYLGVDASADLRFGSNTNHGTNALVLTTANYVSQFGSFAGDIIPSADSTYDLGSNASKWAEGHFDHLYVGETGNNPRIDIYTENGTASIADTFTDTSTDKSYIYFQAGTNSNDPGYIMHETSESSSPDERNEGVLHLVPSDDNASTDYVSIHGTNDPDAIRIYTNGLIQSANYQLTLQSGSGDVYINDGLSVNGQVNVTGDIRATADSSYDIGTNITRFRSGYFDNIYGIVDKLEITSNDSFNGTYSLLWHDGANNVFSSTFMTINGTTDTFSVPNISTTGDVTVGGDLNVTGSINQSNITNLQVEDKTITLNFGSGDTSSTADNSGIIIQDAVSASTDASILWDTANDRFEFSHGAFFDNKVIIDHYHGLEVDTIVQLPLATSLGGTVQSLGKGGSTGPSGKGIIEYKNFRDFPSANSNSKVLNIAAQSGVWGSTGYGPSYIRFSTGASNADTTEVLLLGPDNRATFSGQVTLPLSPVDSTDAVNKGYVDNLVGGSDTLAEVLSNGNTTGGTDIVVSSTDQIFLPNGSNTHPAITFTGDTDTGLSYVTNGISFSVGGNSKFTVGGSQITAEENLIVNGSILGDDYILVEGNTNPYVGALDITNEIYTWIYAGDAMSTLGYTGSEFKLHSGDFLNQQVVFTVDTNENVTFEQDVTVKGSHLTIADGTTYAQSTDYLYIGGSGLGSADAAIYIGNQGAGGGYGYRIYYAGTGSGLANYLTFKSENLGNTVDMLQFNPYGVATFDNHVIIQDNTTQPLASLFEGTLVVQGSTNEDPIIAVTDVNTTNAAAGVFHQSSTSPGFPALVVNAASNGSEQPIISARTNVSNTTGTGGTEVFSVDGDGDAEFAGTVTASGNMSHTGLTMTSGTDVDQLKTVTMSFQLTADTWTDTGIDGTDLSTGTYIVQVYVDDHNINGLHYDEYYSGTMSWYSSSTNSTVVDEIPLHRAGHAPNSGDIQLRTQRASGSDTHDLMLQIKHNRTYNANLDNTDGKRMTFKFRRLI